MLNLWYLLGKDLGGCLQNAWQFLASYTKNQKNPKQLLLVSKKCMLV